MCSDQCDITLMITLHHGDLDDTVRHVCMISVEVYHDDNAGSCQPSRSTPLLAAANVLWPFVVLMKLCMLCVWTRQK